MRTIDGLTDGKFLDWQFSICDTYYEVRNAYLLYTTQIMEHADMTLEEKIDMLNMMGGIYDGYERKLKGRRASIN